MSLNKIMLIGHVGKDPDVRTINNATKVASFSFATTDKAYTLPNGTQVPERTEWHNIIVWNRTAEVAEKYIHKGDKLYLEGKIRTRSYDDKNGIKHFITEVFVDYMEMLNAKPQQSAAPVHQPTAPVHQPTAPAQQPAQPQQQPYQHPTNQQASQYQAPPPPPYDDLPF